LQKYRDIEVKKVEKTETEETEELTTL
jgi:hypothetical protein